MNANSPASYNRGVCVYAALTQIHNIPDLQSILFSTLAEHKLINFTLGT